MKAKGILKRLGILLLILWLGISCVAVTKWETGAPVNGALSDVDMGDMDLLRRMVSNHIARYSNPTSTGTGEAIYMLNGKVMSYDADGAFAGVRLKSPSLKSS